MIDRRVGLLLDALREGGAVEIANAATERLLAIEPDDDAPGDHSDALGDGPASESDADEGYWILDPATALRQLEAADEVVLGRLRLETSLVEAIPGELERLRRAQGDRGEGAGFVVEEMVVVDDAPGSGERERGDGVEVRIADEGRVSVIASLERAWSAARGLTEGSIRDGV